jgi:hypothetical protein
LQQQHKKLLDRYFTVACGCAEPVRRGVLREFKFHKEQAAGSPIGLQEDSFSGSPPWQASDARHLSQRTIIARTKTRQSPAIY